MPNLNPNQRIYDVLRDIDRDVYRLPNIQRGFEWAEDRICKLLDSILHEYPIGAIMVWLPPEKLQKDIQSRPFVANFDSADNYLSEPAHPSQQESYLVLDGQQRLQSLYLAFFGTYNGRRVYFRIDYVASGDDDSCPFEILLPAEANSRIDLVHPSELIQLDYRTKSQFAEVRASLLCSPTDNQLVPAEQEAVKRAVIMQNVDRFIESFNMRPVLLIQEVSRQHNYDQVLEIFQRVNSGGMTLSKSDLMFCTLKLKIQDMEEVFAESLSSVNQAGRYAFTRDFLIKASLVVFAQGAQYEVSKLKSDAFIGKLRDGFEELFRCLRQLMMWLEADACINNGRFLRSENALIPLLDYMYHSGLHDRPEGSDNRYFLQYLYMAFLTRLYSRGGDRTLDQLHSRVEQSLQESRRNFPISVVRDYICKRMNVSWELSEHHFADDPELMLNIVDRGALQLNADEHPDQKLERDHIFPRKILTDYGLGDLADHIGNYRLIVMPLNRRKKASMPTDKTEFYGRHNPVLEPLYETALTSLSRETYQAFRDERAALIVGAVNDFLRLDADVEPGQSRALLGHSGSKPAFVADTDETTDLTPVPAVTNVVGPEGLAPIPLELERLRTAYQSDTNVRLLIDHFASRQRNQTISPVDTLERALDAAGTPMPRHMVIEALRQLDSFKIGRFIPGRKGYPTRFEWQMKSTQVKAIAVDRQTMEAHG